MGLGRRDQWGAVVGRLGGREELWSMVGGEGVALLL